MREIAFIGVGIMGKAMVRNLMKAGYHLHIYARHQEKVQDVISEGASFYDTIGECVEDKDAVITMVGYPADVEEVYFAPGNILDRVSSGTYLIDMTTTSPALAQRIYAAGRKADCPVLDAPVTGGDTGARAGTLSILVGGDKAVYDACRELFAAMGTNINYLGAAGSGQHAKMANQIMIAGTLSGVCEALTYARAMKLDLEVVLKSVATGAAGSKQLELFGPKIISQDYEPGFYIKHFIKDMQIAADVSQSNGLHLEILKQVLHNYKELADAGLGDLGTQALIKHYEN